RAVGVVGTRGDALLQLDDAEAALPLLAVAGGRLALLLPVVVGFHGKPPSENGTGNELPDATAVSRPRTPALWQRPSPSPFFGLPLPLAPPATGRGARGSRTGPAPGPAAPSAAGGWRACAGSWAPAPPAARTAGRTARTPAARP